MVGAFYLCLCRAIIFMESAQVQQASMAPDTFHGRYIGFALYYIFVYGYCFTSRLFMYVINDDGSVENGPNEYQIV